MTLILLHLAHNADTVYVNPECVALVERGAKPATCSRLLLRTGESLQVTGHIDDIADQLRGRTLGAHTERAA